MLSFRSSLVAVSLTAAALALAACTSDDETPISPAETTEPRALDVTKDDGSCDPAIIDIDHEAPAMALIVNYPSGLAESTLETTVHFTDPGRPAEPGGGIGYGGGDGQGGHVTNRTDIPNEDIDHVEVSVTSVAGASETCTIDVD